MCLLIYDIEYTIVYIYVSNCNLKQHENQPSLQLLLHVSFFTPMQPNIHQLIPHSY